MKARFQCFFLTFLTRLWLSSNASRCPKECECHTYIEIVSNASTSSFLVTCNARGLTTFPKDIQPNVTHLDLSSNRLSEIPKKIFHHMSSLRELILADNPIVDIPDGGFNHLTSLQNLCMSETFLEAVPVFTVPSPIVHLHLDKTNISELSPDSLRYYSKLESLHLKGSKIKRLVNGVFRHAPSLKYLRMEYSTLEYIDAGAFDGLQLEKLSLRGTSIRSLPVGGLAAITSLDLEDVYNLWQMHASQHPKIRHLLSGYEFSCCSLVDNSFGDTGNADHHVLQEHKHSHFIPSTFFPRSTRNPRGKENSKILPSNSPKATKKVRSSPSWIFSTSKSLPSSFPRIPGNASSNVYSILSTTTSSISNLRNPSGRFHSILKTTLSTNVSESARVLHKKVNSSYSSSSAVQESRTIPANLPSFWEGFTNRIRQKASVHPSIELIRGSSRTNIPMDVHIEWPSTTSFQHGLELNENNLTNVTKLLPTHANSGKSFSKTTFLQKTLVHVTKQFLAFGYNGTLLIFSLDPCNSSGLAAGSIDVSRFRKKRIICRPRVDVFNLCEDILGSLVLRVSTWLVAVCAIAGNLVTLVVILLNRRKISNHKLLMCTLAFSSLCMGLYLIILAAMDAGMVGYNKDYVEKWQRGVGCKIAGFLSIFSTELSVFTLNIITLERYYTILFPLHQNKWMTVRQTAISLVLSLMAALVLAALPLTGISSYTKVAVCLPFDVTTLAAKAYVTFLLASNGASFFAVLFAYIKMYVNIQHTARDTFTDLNIAKKMAVIVLTNFACWAPVAIFSLIAIYWKPLIDVSMSKFLLVFVFPINAVTNPFLYFLTTKRCQQDLLTIFYRCCAGSQFERTSSFRTSFINRSSPRRSSGNNLFATIRRSPRRSSGADQGSIWGHSVGRGVEERRGPGPQRTVTSMQPRRLGNRSRRGSAGGLVITTKLVRKHSYDLTAKHVNIFTRGAENINKGELPSRILVLRNCGHEHNGSENECDTPCICESVC